MEERERYIRIIDKTLERIENVGVLSLLSMMVILLSMMLEKVDQSIAHEEK